MHQTLITLGIRGKLAALVVVSCVFAGQASAVEFARDVRPIFERHCVKCHDETLHGGLRLNSRRYAFMPADSGEPVIQKGHSADSLLIKRVTAPDPEHRMPKDAEPLSAAEIQTLREWIDAGADWPEGDEAQLHWAYVKPVRPELPKVDSDWPRNPVDFFILAKLQKEGLEPTARAGKAKLLRRVSLDLIGLPPTPEEIEAFVADGSPGAYEKVVDRLLKSPRYGEKWARQWLDLARYADSNGFQADQLRDNWAFRDWVINAFNADMPYDEFTVDQIAGDLLPDATVDQKIATGFHRMTTCNVEAGVHPEENRVNQVIDRVNTTGTVWLGTTIECCQCHNHKYDPFTMKDYYSLFAYFNNTPLEVRNPSGKGVSFDFWGPKMDLPLPPDQDRELKRLRDQQAANLAEQKQLKKELAAGQADWERRMLAALDETPVWRPLEIVHFSGSSPEDYEILEDQSLLLPGASPDKTTYTVRARTSLKEFTALKLEALTDEKLPSTGPGRNPQDGRPNFVLQEFQVALAEPSGDGERQHPLTLINPQADFSQNNFTPDKLIDGKLNDRQNGWAIANEFGKPHWVSFGTSEPVKMSGDALLVFKLTQNYGGGRTIGRLRLSAINGEPGQMALPAEIAAILRKDKRSKKEAQQLAEYHETSHPRYAMLSRELADLKKRIAGIEPPTTLVMVEEEERETHILVRGNYLNPGKEVSYGTPAILNSQSPGAPKNRLGLAEWLVDPENPLVSRVAVNRWWAEIMGHGIVASLEDFGTQSEPPTHPRLLDWLAVEFVEHGWSMKHIHKLIVMSATYQQDSTVTPELLERDPANKLYARGPRFRMSAEQIRDNALAVSGLLSKEMGGPPVMPYQPDGIWRQVGRNEPKWVESPGDDRYRRGIYIVYRRAAPYPSMVNFDAPDRGACTVQRPRTNTPLQALTLLNDPAYVEMALALAQRLITERPEATVEDRIRHGVRLVLARDARPEEIRELARVYAGELAAFQKDVREAQDLVNSSNRWKPEPGTSESELAAWFTVANILLNLDETVTKG